MAYRYSYGTLLGSKTTDTNFKPINEILSDTESNEAYTNMATALLEQKGLIAGTDELNQFLPLKNTTSAVAGLQNIANLTEADTAEARGDVWGGSDATMGKSFLEAIVAGETSGVELADLYTKGFGRDADEGGLEYWQSQLETQGLANIASSFLASEEAGIRDQYHEYYGRDVDQGGLDYWMDHTGPDTNIMGPLQTTATPVNTIQPEEAFTTAEGTTVGPASPSPAIHNIFNATELVGKILQDEGTAETSVRNLLSEQLGLHSSDAQREGDTTLHGVFTDAAEEDVNRLVGSWNLGGQSVVEEEIQDKVNMQKAAASMGDFGGGEQDQGATNIHRMLSSEEMGQVVDQSDPDSLGGLVTWKADPVTKAKTAADYNPQITIPDEGNIPLPLHGGGPQEQNVWSILQPGTQGYDNVTPRPTVTTTVGGVGNDTIEGGTTNDTVTGGTANDTVTGGTTTGGATTGSDPYQSPDPIIVNNEDTEYTPNLSSDIPDLSSYGDAKSTFDERAGDVNIPITDVQGIRSSAFSTAGRSAKGVRLKRSKKFKSGQSALGTQQFGRKLQIKSLNV